MTDAERIAALEREGARLRGTLQDIKNALQTELNPCNYNHDDVCRLNSEAINAFLLARDALSPATPNNPRSALDVAGRLGSEGYRTVDYPAAEAEQARQEGYRAGLERTLEEVERRRIKHCAARKDCGERECFAEAALHGNKGAALESLGRWLRGELDALRAEAQKAGKEPVKHEHD